MVKLYPSFIMVCGYQNVRHTWRGEGSWNGSTHGFFDFIYFICSSEMYFLILSSDVHPPWRVHPEIARASPWNSGINDQSNERETIHWCYVPQSLQPATNRTTARRKWFYCISAHGTQWQISCWSKATRSYPVAGFCRDRTRIKKLVGGLKHVLFSLVL